ncbi:MvaI/BcnI family restriction endonuclease [Crocosphaera sp. XPORK-15E]|uniref:MvaI/BcnI family restriction endonuclease n=1 Tax=Crocosphaera sp. XPORK-15E TaxID=3110247 RepID=UPI002B1F4B80|nr:MvaI/BcnI family restriction endonuclease [Crocosphaera sp. XPORK-15E]MEA5533191.1 MvaI/BcnI family restriction endonuclease [Crocosphaera sp. XPORK-15E]
MIDNIYTKESLISKLNEIRSMGWISNTRPGNSGGVGNTLEDLLGLKENNLPIPNAAEWELKCQRSKTNSLITLFHMEPSPTALKFVPNMLLPNYGWKHKEAGLKYPKTEKSFRQTISSLSKSDRGFTVVVDKNQQKVMISFDSKSVDSRHKNWLTEVKINIGLNELLPQPYWGFQDLYHKAGTKLHNCFFVLADTKKEESKEFFYYSKIFKLSMFSLTKFITAIEQGLILIDFDARTGHNHGTKFRIRNKRIIDLYESVEEII